MSRSTLPFGTRTYSACVRRERPPYRWLYPNNAAGGGICFYSSPHAVSVVSVFTTLNIAVADQKKQSPQAMSKRDNDRSRTNILHIMSCSTTSPANSMAENSHVLPTSGILPR
ncbi:hypothetical protein KCP69_21570 [Salmonella enterica subsp. enterica]|nr:hypothetical protein KCP69_21570 [Salmonella enterica subsp. enterica]